MNRLIENFVLAMALSTVEAWSRIWSDKSDSSDRPIDWSGGLYIAATEAYSILLEFESDALRND